MLVQCVARRPKPVSCADCSVMDRVSRVRAAQGWVLTAGLAWLLWRAVATGEAPPPSRAHASTHTHRATHRTRAAAASQGGGQPLDAATGSAAAPQARPGKLVEAGERPRQGLGLVQALLDGPCHAVALGLHALLWVEVLRKRVHAHAGGARATGHSPRQRERAVRGGQAGLAVRGACPQTQRGGAGSAGAGCCRRRRGQRGAPKQRRLSPRRPRGVTDPQICAPGHWLPRCLPGDLPGGPACLAGN